MLVEIIFIVAIYFFFVFVGLRLVVPYYGFGEEPPVPSEIPPYLQQEIERLNKISKSDEEFLENAYNYIIHQYTGGRFKTFYYWKRSFGDIFWHKTGFLPCTKQNQLLKIMLVKSGRFEEKDIHSQVVFLNFFIHQYLRVKVGNMWKKIDPMGHSIGIPFGKRAFLFA